MNPSCLDWLKTKQASDQMQTESIPLSEVEEPWGFKDGDYQREDGKFFRITGQKTKSNAREVEGWTQPVLEELGSPGTVVLIVDRTRKKILVTAKPEPGNPKEVGHTLLAPSIQTSSANLEKAHGGERPPLADVMDMTRDKVKVLFENVFHEDGGRFKGKKNNIKIIEVASTDIANQQMADNQMWADIEEVEEVIQKGMANPFLRDTMALLYSLPDGENPKVSSGSPRRFAKTGSSPGIWNRMKNFWSRINIFKK